jgi:hypothetical protein
MSSMPRYYSLFLISHFYHFPTVNFFLVSKITFKYDKALRRVPEISPNNNRCHSLAVYISGRLG